MPPSAQNLTAMHYRLLLVLACLLTSAFAAESRPNILLILSDDHGWSQLSRTMDPGVPEAQSSYLRTPRRRALQQRLFAGSTLHAHAPQYPVRHDGGAKRE